MLGINSKRKQMNGEYVQAVKMVKYSTMPCVFSEDEMDDEIRMSELSGTVTHEEVLENLRGGLVMRIVWNKRAYERFLQVSAWYAENMGQRAALKF